MLGHSAQQCTSKNISCRVHGWFHKTVSGVLPAGCQEACSSLVSYTERAFELFAGNPYCAYIANIALEHLTLGDGGFSSCQTEVTYNS